MSQRVSNFPITWDEAYFEMPTVPYMCPFGCGNNLQQTGRNTAICGNCGRLIFAVEPRKLDKVAA